MSPNYDERCLPISLLILHYTQMPRAAALARLCDRQAKVSTHYFIDQRGEVIKLVDEQYRAWHAGVSHWHGIDDINSASIGIELEHLGHDDKGQMTHYPEAQIQSLIALSLDIITRHQILPRYVLGHSDIAPERKIDPGEALSWQRLAQAGIGLWVDPTDHPPIDHSSRDISTIQQQLRDFGYSIALTGSDDEQTHIVIKAFQRHFRPARIDGIADPQTQNILASLLAAC